jgi:hypothetical protein
MMHMVQIGNGCVCIDGVNHTFQEATNFAYRITVAVRMQQSIAAAEHDHPKSTAETCVHDAMGDHQREPVPS